jgi:hypothetical protein
MKSVNFQPNGTKKTKKYAIGALLLVPLFSLFVFNTFFMGKSLLNKARQPEVYLGEPGQGGGAGIPADSDEVSLFLEPSYLETNLNETFEVELNMNTKSKTIGGMDMILGYDPAFVKVKSIDPGYIFSEPQINQQEGRIVFKASEEVIGKGKIASIYFETDKSGRTNLEISPQASVWNKNKKEKATPVVNYSEILIN